MLDCPVEELIAYAFGLDDDRCCALLENINRLFISHQAKYMDIRDEFMDSNLLY